MSVSLYVLNSLNSAHYFEHYRRAIPIKIVALRLLLLTVSNKFPNVQEAEFKAVFEKTRATT